MTVLARLLDRRAISYQDVWGAGGEFPTGQTVAGVPVDQAQALRLVACYASVRLLSETVASLPIAGFTRQGTQRFPLPSQPRWIVAPNKEETRFEVFEQAMASLNLDGNAYLVPTRDRFLDVVEIFALDPTAVVPFRDPQTREIFYAVQLTNGERVIVPFTGILHIRAFRTAGSLKGISPIEKARQMFGLGMAAEEYGARFFGQSAMAGGVIEAPNTMTREQITEMLTVWRAHHSGVKKAHVPGVLAGGASWKQITLAPEHAQFLETRKFQVEEVARLFRVPPHMIASLDRATFSNIEHQGIEFVVHSIRPWLERIEQATVPLLPAGAFLKFNVEGLLRGDTASRFTAYGSARQWGWMSVDEIRALEDRPPLPNGKGQIYLEPANMQPAGSGGAA